MKRVVTIVLLACTLSAGAQEITFYSRGQKHYFQHPEQCIEMLSRVDRIGMYVGYLNPDNPDKLITDEELRDIVDVANALGKGFFVEVGGVHTWFRDDPETVAVNSFTQESSRVARLVELGANIEYIFYDNPLIRLLMSDGLNGGTMDGDWTLEETVHELAKVTAMWKDYIPGVKVGLVGSPVWRSWKGEGPFAKPQGLLEDGYYDIYEMLEKVRTVFPLYYTSLDAYEIDFPYNWIDEKLAAAQHHANDQAYWVNRLIDIENEVKNAGMEFVFIFNDKADSREDFNQDVHAWIDLYCNQYGGNPDIYNIQNWDYDHFHEPQELMPETTPYTYSWIVNGILDQYQPTDTGTLFSDGFESGSFTNGGWTTTGNATVKTLATYSGTNCAVVTGAGVLTKAFSTEGRTGLSLSFAWRCSGGEQTFGAGETLIAEWTTNGVDWIQLAQTQDSAYAVVEWPLPAEAENQAGFAFRFYETGAGARWGRIDDVSIAPADSNTPPVFIRDLVVKADAGATDDYSGTLANKAVDPDADPVTFSLVSPTNTWLAVAEDGTLSGTPGPGDLGLNSWTVQVSDGTFSNTATLEINVGYGGERVTLFSDGFESGSFTNGGWTLAASPTIITNGQASGAYGAQVEWGDVLTKSLDLSGATNVTLSYAISCISTMPTNTSIALEVSADGGANWIELERTRNSGYVTREWILAPELLTSGFMFRFDKIGTASGDWGRIDDVLVTAAAPEGVQSAPNVIVFLMDDFGLTDVQQHPTYFPDGSPLFETPNMHRLASEGMRFDHMYAQPLCSASRFALLSGQNSAARYAAWAAIVNGATPEPSLPTSSVATRAYNFPSFRDHMPLEIETIAERMKEAGYATWHVGKWHLSPNTGGSNPNPPSTYYPVEQGFDKQLSVGGAGPTPGYFGPFTMAAMNDHKGDPAPGTTGTFLPEHMAGLVQGLLDDHLANNPTQPFFLYYPTYSVHGPHDAKQSRFNYYADKLAGLPDSKHRHPVQAAQVEGVDGELGALLDYMDLKGLTDNTLFIFLSDNGGLVKNESGTLYDDIGPDGIPDAPGVSSDGSYAATTAPIHSSTPLSDMAPRKGGKSCIYEGGMRVPMIVRYPGGEIPPATVSYEPAHLMDIYRTILDYTPATPKAGYTLDGVSLKPVLQQSGALPERDLFHYFPNASQGGYEGEPGGAAVLDYPFKMIATYSTAHDAAAIDYKLYRLDTDVGESDNIAGRFPGVVDAMRQKLDTFYADTGALVPTPNPVYDGTSFDSPEISIDSYLADAGLALLTPETFMIADPDGDARNNRQEFLQQTAPNTSDEAVANMWLSDGELRVALPANTDQSIYSILDATGAVAFTAAELELDGQYGPFFVYKPTSPVPSPDPADYTIAVADTAKPRSTADFTVDYRALLSGTVSSRTDALLLGNDLLVDTGTGLAVVQDVDVTTTGVSGDFNPGGPNGLAVVGGLSDVWFDSEEKVTLDFAVETTEGTALTNLQVRILDVGARSLDGETVTLSNASVLATATWPSGTSVNGTPGTLTGTFDFASGETLTVQSGPAGGANQRTQLSYLTFRLSDSSMDNTDTDGDLLPDSYEAANPALADGHADEDGDGRTRGQEYVAGTSDSDPDDVYTLGVDGQQLVFSVKDGRAYRLYKRTTLFDPPVLLEDFGIISGDHSVQLPVEMDGDTVFYQLEAYLP